MLNDSKWTDIGENVFELRTADNSLIATLSFNECVNEWVCELAPIFDDMYGYVLFIVAATNDEAKWKATVELSNYCNGIISNMMKIRNHLPELGLLYDNAFRSR